jgi:hypothetical protein
MNQSLDSLGEGCEMNDVQSARRDAVRQGWRELCEQVAQQNDPTEELASLTELLKLPLNCCLAVHQVLKEGNWAKADSPRTYIKKAAMTQARKIHLLDDALEYGDGPLVFMDGDKLDRRGDREGGIEAALESDYRKHGKPRPGRMTGRHCVPEQFEPDHVAEEIAERLAIWSDDCWIKPKGAAWRRDWKKLGEKVGLDPWEIRVLEFRSRGIGRDSAMGLQPDEVSRKAIQAAWKRVDRSRMDKLRDYLKKNSLEDVPDQNFPRTREVRATNAHRKELQQAWQCTEGKSITDLGVLLKSSRLKTLRSLNGPPGSLRPYIRYEDDKAK